MLMGPPNTLNSYNWEDAQRCSHLGALRSRTSVCQLCINETSLNTYAKCGFKSWTFKYGTYSLIKKKQNKTKSLFCEPSWPSCYCGGTDTAAKEAMDLRHSSISLKSEHSCIISEQKLCGASQWLSGKEFTCGAEVVGNMGLIPGWERSPGGGHGSPPQYSCLKNLMNRGTNSGNLACSHA